MLVQQPVFYSHPFFALILPIPSPIACLARFSLFKIISYLLTLLFKSNKYETKCSPFVIWLKYVMYLYFPHVTMLFSKISIKRYHTEKVIKPNYDYDRLTYNPAVIPRSTWNPHVLKAYDHIFYSFVLHHKSINLNMFLYITATRQGKHHN